MKDSLMLLFSALFFLFVTLIFLNAVTITIPATKAPELPSHRTSSITFILGEDTGSSNPFYRNAQSYFSHHPEAQTDMVITHVRSLNGMIHELNDIHERIGVKFTDIHMVVHSNPWAGMSLSVDEKGQRITSLTLKERNSDIGALNCNAVDSSTITHIHACGLGSNHELLETLRPILNQSQLLASDTYVNFTAAEGIFTKSEMEVFYAFYPTAYKPANQHLATQMKGRYPSTNINWLEKLQGAPHRYNIPVEWEVTYPEYDTPSLSNELDKMEWLMNQDDLLEIIEKTGIPFDYFRWRVTRENDSIKVRGKVTVVCIMRKVNVV